MDCKKKELRIGYPLPSVFVLVMVGLLALVACGQDSTPTLFPTKTTATVIPTAASTPPPRTAPATSTAVPTPTVTPSPTKSTLTPTATAAPTPEPTPEESDDHGDSPEDATIIAFGEKQIGYLDADEHDVFQFEAKAGFIYELILTLDLLSDNWADLTLNIRDSHYDNLSIFYAYEEEPEIFKWMAETYGTHYLNLSSFDEGSYELQVDITALRDDRPNSIAAMDGRVGGPSDGSPVSAFPAVLEYHDDIDFFRFDATAGDLYRIEVLRHGRNRADYDPILAYLQTGASLNCLP